MIRWQATIVLSFLASLVAASSCSDPPITPPSTGGGGGGGGGVFCDPGYTLVPCAESVTYVALLDRCPEGTTPLTLLQCDSCECATQNVPCIVSGTIHDSSVCTNPQPFEFTDASGCSAMPNTPSTFIEASVHTGECVAAPGEPALGACRIELSADPSLQCPSDEVCVADWMPICVLMDADADCPAGFLPENTIDGIQQDGTCGCDCVGSGMCPQEVHFYSDPDPAENCLMSEPNLTVTADGSCQSAAGIGPLRHVARPAGPECQAASSPSGGTDKKLCCLNAF